MKLYRVCTENKNYQDVTKYLDEHFPDGYTIINANGAWQGKREKSLIIEIVGEMHNIDPKLEKLCYWLKKHNQQETILHQVINVEVGLI